MVVSVYHLEQQGNIVCYRPKTVDKSQFFTVIELCRELSGDLGLLALG